MPSTEEVVQEKSIYALCEWERVQKGVIPFHIGLIMDGNRRWATEQGLQAYFGHLAGAQSLIRVAHACRELGVKVLTAFSFSTENWRRSAQEVDAVFALSEQFLKEQTHFMIENGIRLSWIGDIEPLPASLQATFHAVKDATKLGRDMDFVLAMNYGSRDEIKRAVKRLCADFEEGKIGAHALSEETIGGYLDTALFPDPDLLIRTGGEKRLSNFMLWQMQYTEIAFVDTPWPEFHEKELLEQVMEFQRRKRNRGA